MKKILCFALFLLFVSSSVCFAHPPSDIKMTYDSDTNMLTVVLTHEVRNPDEHFIKKVDIGLNGKEIITHQISRQSNNITQMVVYMIPDAKPGDVLSAEGYCSLSGALEKELKI